MSAEDRLAAALERLGPLTGAELQEEAGGDSFSLWKAAMLSQRLEVRAVGTRYLRLDRKVERFARLSPSILREFLTYSVVGLAADPDALDRRAAEVIARIRAISRAKLELAGSVVAGVAARLEGAAPQEQFCVFIAGDVVFDMAHDVPRPERSTGKMVRGSDIDLVVVVDDDAPETLVRRLDEEIYQRKYRYLISPSAREEIDYIVKRFTRMREQMAFDTFKQMVACKILDEGVFLHGDRRLFDAAKALLEERGVTRRLADLHGDAARHRREAERSLLTLGEDVLSGEALQLFYTTDESEEFE